MPSAEISSGAATAPSATAGCEPASATPKTRARLSSEARRCRSVWPAVSAIAQPRPSTAKATIATTGSAAAASDGQRHRDAGRAGVQRGREAPAREQRQRGEAAGDTARAPGRVQHADAAGPQADELDRDDDHEHVETP